MITGLFTEVLLLVKRNLYANLRPYQNYLTQQIVESYVIATNLKIANKWTQNLSVTFNQLTGVPSFVASEAHLMTDLCVLYFKWRLYGHVLWRLFLPLIFPVSRQVEQPFSPLNCFIFVTRALACRSSVERSKVAWTVVSPAVVVTVIPVEQREHLLLYVLYVSLTTLGYIHSSIFSWKYNFKKSNSGCSTCTHCLVHCNFYSWYIA